VVLTQVSVINMVHAARQEKGHSLAIPSLLVPYICDSLDIFSIHVTKIKFYDKSKF